MAYTPPATNAMNFELVVYTPVSLTELDFTLDETGGSTTYSKDNSVKASIVVSNTKSQSVKASIRTTNTKSNSVKANIKSTVLNGNSAKASIVTTVTKGQSVKSSIVVTNTKSQSSKASIYAINSKENSVIANIKNTNRYWVGGTGNWADTSHWSYTSGGTSGAIVPSSIDDVFIDSNSGFGSGGTINWNNGANTPQMHNISCTSGHTYTITGNYNIEIYGSVILEAGLTFETRGVAFLSSVSETITSNGCIFAGYSDINYDYTAFGENGSWTLIDDFSIEQNVRVYGDFNQNGQTITTTGSDGYIDIYEGNITLNSNINGGVTLNKVTDGPNVTLGSDIVLSGSLSIGGGIFDANDYNITARDFSFFSFDANPPTIYMGSGTWEATGNDDYSYPWYVYQYGGTVVTIYPETSTIKFTDSTSLNKSFFFYDGLNNETGKTYNNLWLTGSGTGEFIIYGSNTFNEIKVDTPPHTVRFEENKTTTVSSFDVNGTSGNLITIDSYHRLGIATSHLSNAGTGYSVDDVCYYGDEVYIAIHVDSVDGSGVITGYHIEEVSGNIQLSHEYPLASGQGDNNAVIVIDSLTEKTQHTLSKSSGTVNCDYLDITYSIATGGATWYAGINSVDSGNNSGWIFTKSSTNSVKANICYQKIDNLFDNFDDDSFDTNKWQRTNDTQILETSGHLELNSILAGNYVSVDSIHLYDLTGKSASLELVSAGNQSLTSWETYPLTLLIDSNNYLQFRLIGGNLQCFQKVSGVSTQIGGTVTYDSDVHKWLRIREESGTIYFDYSTNGLSWTNISSTLNPIAITGLQVEFSVGTWQAEASTTSMLIDNFNISPILNWVKANIVAPSSFGNYSKASIVATNTKANSVKANIKRTVTGDNSSKASIVTTVTKTNSSKADILVTGNTKSNSVKASIVVSNSKSQSVKADIKSTLTKDNSSKASIVVANNYPQSVKANIKRLNETKNNSVKASIVTTNTNNQSVKANIGGKKDNSVKSSIVVTNTDTNSSKSNILATSNYGQNVKANIIKSTTSSNSVKASIVVTNSDSNSSKASIVTTNTDSNSVKSNILVPGNVFNNSVKSSIVTTNTKNQSVKADIKSTLVKGNNTKSNIVVTNSYQESVKANILTTGVKKDNSSKASIVVTNSNNQSVKASIVVSNTKNNSVKSSIVTTNTDSQSVKADIKSTISKDNSSKASIVVANNYPVSTKANILATVSKGSFSKASIVVENKNSNSVKANIGGKVDNNVKSSIVVTNHNSQSIKANIIRFNETYGQNVKSNIFVGNNVKDNATKSNIVISNTNDNSVKSSIVVTNNNNQSTKANILAVLSKDNFVRASIMSFDAHPNYVKANILRTNETKDSSVKSSIFYKDASHSNFVKASILRTESYDSNSKANVSVRMIHLQNSKANILSTRQQSNDVTANILRISIPAENYVKSNIVVTSTTYNNVKCNISISPLYDNFVKANIGATSTYDNNVKAQIVYKLGCDNYVKANIKKVIIYRSKPYQTKTAPIYQDTSSPYGNHVSVISDGMSPYRKKKDIYNDIV